MLNGGFEIKRPAALYSINSQVKMLYLHLHIKVLFAPDLIVISALKKKCRIYRLSRSHAVLFIHNVKFSRKIALRRLQVGVECSKISEERPEKKI